MLFLIRSASGHWILGVREGGERSPELWLGSSTPSLALAGPCILAGTGSWRSCQEASVWKWQQAVQSPLQGSGRRELVGTCSVLEQRLRQTPVKLFWEEAGETELSGDGSPPQPNAGSQCCPALYQTRFHGGKSPPGKVDAWDTVPPLMPDGLTANVLASPQGSNALVWTLRHLGVIVTPWAKIPCFASVSSWFALENCIYVYTELQKILGSVRD